MRAVIFLNGNKISKDVFLRNIRKDDFIICADGGIKHAFSLGVEPDLYIGDKDSTSADFLRKIKKNKIKTIEFPKEKDMTDSELSIEYAIKNGFREIAFFCADGDRTDHFLANIFGITKYKDVEINIINNKEIIYFITGECSLKGIIGDTVSLIPYSKDVEVEYTKGLRWELKNEILFFGRTRGVSNIFVKEKVYIKVKAGGLMVIHQV